MPARSQIQDVRKDARDTGKLNNALSTSTSDVAAMIAPRSINLSPK